MRLGVLIPCYNHERYVGAAIESVLGQTRLPDRFLVIDDGSKDSSVQVIRRYEKDRVECMPQKNAGAHAAINRGVELLASDCDVIAILNSDDIFEPERFKTLLSGLPENKAVVCSGLRLIDATGEFLPEDAPRGKWFRAAWSIGKDDNISLCEWLGSANFLGTTSNILMRSAYAIRNPFRAYRYVHDYFFLAGAAIRDQLTVIPEPLLRYRVHETNTINTDPAPLVREQLRMHLDLYAEVALEFEGNPEIRARFGQYARAGWNSISSFDAGLFQELLAMLASQEGEEEIARLVADFDSPDLSRFPNTALIKTHDGEAPLLSSTSALSERVGELTEQTKAQREEITALKSLNRLRAQLAGSAWVSLGGAFGANRAISSNIGKTPSEKLELLQAAVEENGWIQTGRKLGLCRDIETGQGKD